MDYLEYIISLSVDGLFIGYCLHQYLSNKALVDAFKVALDRGVNPSQNEVKEARANKKWDCAIVQGNVEALGPTIKSVNRSFLSGVIQKLTIKEHALTRSTAGYWRNRERIMDVKFNIVPFELRNGKYSVTINSALDATHLDLDVLEDRFEPSLSNIFSNIFGFIVGTHTKGVQYTEYMLQEKTRLTGFGEISVNSNSQLQLGPPTNGLYYILSTLEPTPLLKKLQGDRDLYRFYTIFWTCVGVGIGAFAIRKWLRRRREHLALVNMRKKKENAMIKRRRQVPTHQAATGNADDDERLLCIICCVNEREVVLLPCGHVSVCYDCAQHIRGACPVCREGVANMTPIFIT